MEVCKFLVEVGRHVVDAKTQSGSTPLVREKEKEKERKKEREMFINIFFSISFLLSTLLVKTVKLKL
jgi:hypothetical protein